MTPSWSRRLRYATIAVGFGACAAWATPGLAQISQPGPMNPNGTSLGPPGGTGAQLFKLDVLGKIQYDSNVARGNVVVDTARALHKDDVLYEPTVQVNLNKQINREDLFLTGSVGYDWHQYNKQLDSNRINLLGGGIARLGSCSGTLTLGYAEAQTDLSTLPLTVTKNVSTTESVGGQLRCTAGKIGAFVTTNASSNNNNSSAAAGLINSNSVSVNSGVTYQNKLVGIVSAFGGYSSSSYDNTSGAAVLAATGFRTYSGGLSIERPIGARLKGSAQVSYEKSESRGGAAPIKVTGLGAQGSLDYRVNSRINASLQFAREVQPTIQLGSTFTIVDDLQLNVRYKLSSRLSVGGGGELHQIDYRGVTTALPNLITSDKTDALFANIGLKIGRSGNLVLDGRWEHRNTNLTIFDYTDYRVGITASQSF